MVQGEEDSCLRYEHYSGAGRGAGDSCLGLEHHCGSGGGFMYWVGASQWCRGGGDSCLGYKHHSSAGEGKIHVLGRKEHHSSTGEERDIYYLVLREEHQIGREWERDPSLG